MNPVKSKKYDFDITVTDNTYAGELALPYVTAAVTGAETILNNRCRLIEGVVNKAVISNLACPTLSRPPIVQVLTAPTCH